MSLDDFENKKNSLNVQIYELEEKLSIVSSVDDNLKKKVRKPFESVSKGKSEASSLQFYLEKRLKKS